MPTWSSFVPLTTFSSAPSYPQYPTVAGPRVLTRDCLFFGKAAFAFILLTCSISPSLDTYAKLLAHAESFGSFDGGDQGLFNAYFSDWSTADINRILPFGYNVHAAATYTYAPAYKV